jgi:hypothetical protein
MRNRLYTVRTAAGIIFHIEASDQHTAWQRAQSSALADHLARMMREAVKGVVSVEPLRGPARRAVFGEEFFR